MQILGIMVVFLIAFFLGRVSQRQNVKKRLWNAYAIGSNFDEKSPLANFSSDPVEWAAWAVARARESGFK